MMDQRNLILAIVLSVAILLTFQFLVVEPRQVKTGSTGGQVTEQAAPSGQTAGTAPGAPMPPSATGVAPDSVSKRWPPPAAYASTRRR
jgi:YidC/Oxa1 family membrane protein insertase